MIDVNPKEAYAYDFYKIGVCYYTLQQYDSALTYYKKSLIKNPSYTYSLNNVGYIYQLQRQYDSSIVYLKKCISSDPKYFTAYSNLAYSYELANQLDSAITYNEKVYNYFKDSTSSGALANLGYEYLKIKDSVKSLYYLTLADKIYNDASTKYNLCCYYSLTGDTTKALELLTAALEKKYNNYEHIQTDKDLDPIRKEPGFTGLLKKYFPDKFK